MMKNAFNFMLKAVFVRLFDFAGKWLDKQAKINFKTDWTTSNYNTHVAQYLKKQRQTSNDIC